VHVGRFVPESVEVLERARQFKEQMSRGEVRPAVEDSIHCNGYWFGKPGMDHLVTGADD
jgi:hypothetical protein